MGNDSNRRPHSDQTDNDHIVPTAVGAAQESIQRFCLSQLGCPETARDAAQETSLRALQLREKFRGDSTAKTWLLGIAVNVCRELRRSKTRSSSSSPIHDAVADGGDPAAALARRDEIDHLHTTLDRLTPRQREVVVLRYLEELSVSETSEVLGIAAGTIKATTFQAIQIMKEFLLPVQEVM